MYIRFKDSTKMTPLQTFHSENGAHVFVQQDLASYTAKSNFCQVP